MKKATKMVKNGASIYNLMTIEAVSSDTAVKIFTILNRGYTDKSIKVNRRNNSFIVRNLRGILPRGKTYQRMIKLGFSMVK